MRRAKAAAWWWMFPGAAAGLAAVRIAEMPDRWVAAAAVGAWTAAAALAWGQVRRAALLIFVLSLQVGLALYLTDPPPAPSVGASWPSAPALPLASLTAAAALAARRQGPWTWGGGIAVGAALLGLTTAASLLSSPEIMAGVAHLLLAGAYYLVFLAAANAVQDRADLDLALRALMASLATQSGIYFVQAFVGGTFTPAGEWIPADGELGRYGGTAGARPAMFSSFLLPLLLTAAAHLLTAERGIWLCGPAAAAGLAALILTFTRASWTGLALGLAYLAAAAARRRWLAPRRIGGAALIFLVLMAALSPKLASRLREDHRAAFDERWALVRMAVRVIEAHPLFGVGAGAYPYVFRQYLTPELSDRWLYVVHNVYVLRAAETGLAGLAAWLVFLAAAWRKAAPERMADAPARRLSLGWRAGLVALGWEMLWDVSLGPAANSLLWFLCGLTAAAERIGKDQS